MTDRCGAVIWRLAIYATRRREYVETGIGNAIGENSVLVIRIPISYP